MIWVRKGSPAGFIEWQLWQEELKSDIRLPSSLREKCQAYIPSPLPSKLQDDVISELSSIVEVLIKSGYCLDALMEMHSKKIGIEVDGPSHFVGSKPKGGTLLKRSRQLNT
ncbi:hypothetical protein ACHAW5_001515 [Stephanodiscus triporus]|uniref:Uncharacterized protein n=1 Tax=Stephanodiscus triporus TaxID=2934178 RepID=A0ABD3NGP9_9STRA